MDQHSVTRGYICFVFCFGIIFASVNGCRMEQKIDTILEEVSSNTNAAEK